MRLIAVLLIIAGVVCAATLVFGSKIFGIVLCGLGGVFLWLAWLQDKNNRDDNNDYYS